VSIAITISKSAQDVIARIGDRRGLLAAVAKEIDRQNQFTIGHISSVRMRGNNGKPFPVSEHKLGIRSGQLVKSIWSTPARVTEGGVESSIGSNLKYAGVHEFGGTFKRVQLAGSVRLRTDRNGVLLRQKDGRLAVFAKKRHKSVATVQFAGGKRFDVTVPARAPFRYGIQDRLPAIGDAVSQAVVNFLGGGK